MSFIIKYKPKANKRIHASLYTQDGRVDVILPYAYRKQDALKLLFGIAFNNVYLGDDDFFKNNVDSKPVR